jgi:hypothetical protein
VLKNRIARALLKLMPNVYSCLLLKDEMLSISRGVAPPNTDDAVIKELGDLLWVRKHTKKKKKLVIRH